MNEKKVRVLIIDDYQISGHGSKALLSGVGDIEVTGVFSSASKAMDFLRNNRTNVILLDLLMPEISGLDLLKKIKQINPEIKVIMLTISDEREHILKALAYSADGFLLKDSGRKDLIEAIRKVTNNRFACSPKIMDIIIKDMRIYARKILNTAPQELPEKNQPETRDLHTILTKREIEILELIGRGLSTKEIAVKFDKSPYTISTHRKNIYAKLGISELSQLTQIARELAGERNGKG